MKRILALILIITIMAGIAACAKKEPGSESAVTTAQSSPSPTTSTPTPGLATPSPGAATKTPGAGAATATATATATPTPGKATPTKTVMKDGNYEAKGDPWDKGQESAKIVIKDGKISQVTLMRLDTTGKEVDYTNFDGKTHEGKVWPNLKEFKETMAKTMVEKQSADVDTISGATISTKNWKTAAERAIAKAQSSSS